MTATMTYSINHDDIFSQFQQTPYIMHAKDLLAMDNADELFNLFLACLLANLNDPKILNWYQHFIQASQTFGDTSITTGEPMADVMDFWQKSFHVELKNRLSRQFIVSKDKLHDILPTATYQAFVLLSMDNAKIMQILAENKLLIKAYLNSWAWQLLSKDACALLNSRQNTTLVNDDPTIANDSAPIAELPSLDNLIDNALEQNNNDHQTQQDNHDNQPTINYDQQNDANNPSFNTNPSPNTQDNTTANHTTNGSHSQGTLTKKAKPKNKALLIALALVITALAGVAAWWHWQKPAPIAEIPATTETVAPQAQALPPASIRLTVDQSGGLYACQAELGTEAISQQLLQLLQQSFNQSRCIIDINQNVNQNIKGLDRLMSMIGILKTVSFASLELHGDTLYINAPDANDMTRLVRDIGALMADSGIHVLAMPPLQAAKSIQESIQKSKQALELLADNATDYDIARALNLQILDVSNGEVPNDNLALLQIASKHLINNPSMRLIIVAHSDTLDRIGTQMQADTVKNALISMGVNDGQLIAQGVGTDFPVADNLTDIGRFKNRRIEFLAYDEATMQALSQPIIQQPLTMDEIPSNLEQPETTPTLGVQNGQIVEMPSNTAIPDISDSYQNDYADPALTEYDTMNNPSNYISSPHNAPNTSFSNNSQLDELSKPIYSDPVGAPANALR